MKTLFLWMVIFALIPMPSFAKNSPLDTSIHVANRAEVFERMESLHNSLTQQEALDFEIAIQRLNFHATAAVRIGLSGQEGDALFLGLVNDHTPRQIIFIATALALAESAPITDPHRATTGEESTQRQYSFHLKSEGMGFVKTYAHAGNNEKSNARPEQSQ